MDVALLGPRGRRRHARPDVGDAWHRRLLRFRRAGRPPARRGVRARGASRRASPCSSCTRSIRTDFPTAAASTRTTSISTGISATSRAPLPANAAYAEVHPILLPATWPPPKESEEAIGAYIAKHGERAFQAALTGGQYTFPDGLFFGGTRATWSNRTLRSVLRRHASGRRRVAWIDFHTALGTARARRKDLCGPQRSRRARARPRVVGRRRHVVLRWLVDVGERRGLRHRARATRSARRRRDHRDGARIRDRAAAAGLPGTARRPLAAQSPRSARSAARRRSANRCAMRSTSMPTTGKSRSTPRRAARHCGPSSGWRSRRPDGARRMALTTRARHGRATQQSNRVSCLTSHECSDRHHRRRGAADAARAPCGGVEQRRRLELPPFAGGDRLGDRARRLSRGGAVRALGRPAQPVRL